MWGGGGHYNAWAGFLERWGRGEQLDPATLPSLRREDFQGDSWERLTNRISEALSQRLNGWQEAVTKGMTGATDEFGVARVLGHARWGLRPIRALAAHPGLPSELAEQLLAAVDRQVRSAQESLEDQIERSRRAGLDRRAAEALLRIVRDNDLTVVTTEDPADTGQRGVAAWAIDPAAQSRRRVIL